MMKWTQSRSDNLSHLWHEGLTAAEIGIKIGVSRNAVIGKAHRLKLPARFAREDREWSDADTDALVALWTTRQSVEAFASSMGRTAQACTQRAHILGLPRKPYAHR